MQFSKIILGTKGLNDKLVPQTFHVASSLQAKIFNNFNGSCSRIRSVLEFNIKIYYSIHPILIMNENFVASRKLINLKLYELNVNLSLNIPEVLLR